MRINHERRIGKASGSAAGGRPNQCGGFCHEDGTDVCGPIYNQAIKAADEIKGLSLRIIPQIEKNIARIAVDVERLQAKEDKLILQVEAIEREIEPHTAKIDANYEEKCSKAKENEHIWKYKVEEEYSEKHPEYANLISKRNEISSELSTVRNEKSDRLAFQSRLEQCRAEIEDVKAE